MKQIRNIIFLVTAFFFTQQSFAQTVPAFTSFYPTTAGSGDTVTMHGTGLSSVWGVHFGNGSVALILSQTDTSVMALCGASGSSGIITLNYGSFSDTTSVRLGGFTWSINPIIYSITPITAKQGDTVIITGKFYTGGGFVPVAPTVTFGGVAAANVFMASSNVAKAIVSSGASGNIVISNTYGGSTSYPGFVFKSNCVSTVSTNNITICNSMLPYNWNGDTLNIAGTYRDTLKNYAGCDSIMILNLTVNSCQGTTINSFSPASGPVGTTVTISGANFSSVLANNIVYFGAVKAAVINATTTSLTVTVPAGASYLPISVTANGLIGYSSGIFDVTFANNDTAFTANSFAPKTDYVTDSLAQAPYVSDLDGDGLPDIIGLNLQYYNPYSTYVPKSVSILKNKEGVIFDNLMNAPLNSLSNVGEGRSIVVTDLDGDGKPDIAVSQGIVSVFRNTSSTGSISFAPRNDSVSFSIFSKCDGVSMIVQDLDGDGKPDIAVYDSCYGITIYRNTSNIGNISFDTAFSFGPEYLNSFGFAVSDIDNDGKPDLILTNSGRLQIFRNISQKGDIVFANSVTYNVTNTGFSSCVADFDGDNKSDIALFACDSISIIRNISTPGSINFATNINRYASDNWCSSRVANFAGTINSIAAADIDGDGKPDIIVSNIATNTISVFKNKSTSGVISFQPQVHYATGNLPAQLFVNDVNGDGKPDIEVANSGTNTISVLLNQIGLPIPQRLCNGANDTLHAGKQGSVYQWQVSTDSLHFTDISSNAYYSGANGSKLYISNTPSSWYGYEYRCVIDGTNSDVYTLKFTDTWTSTSNTAWETAGNWSCGTIPDSNTDVIINNGTVVLSSNATVRSLTVNPAASFTIAKGYTLTVNH